VPRAAVMISDNDYNGDDRCARLSGIEIGAHGLVQRKEAGLIAAKAHRGRGAVLQECHKRDLDRTCSACHATDLHDAYRAGDGGSGLDGATKEYIAAAATKREQGNCQGERKEAFHWAPPRLGA